MLSDRERSAVAKRGSAVAAAVSSVGDKGNKESKRGSDLADLLLKPLRGMFMRQGGWKAGD